MKAATKRGVLARVWLGSVMAVVVLTATIAWAAAGAFKLRSSNVQEVSGGWHIYVELALPKAPAIAHQTLKFLVTKTMVYERDLVDNSKDPVISRQTVTNQNPSVESMEVNFSDASGKIFNRTRFDFSLTRTRGYEAGEYKVQVRTSDGIDIGGSQTLVLNGDNPIVDRRSMVFDAKNPNMKKIAGTADAGGPAKADESVAAAPMNGEVAPAGSASPFFTDDAFKKQPEEVAGHPKGCGCHVAGLPDREAAWGLGASAMMVGLVLARRRRRS